MRLVSLTPPNANRKDKKTSSGQYAGKLPIGALPSRGQPQQES